MPFVEGMLLNFEHMLHVAGIGLNRTGSWLSEIQLFLNGPSKSHYLHAAHDAPGRSRSKALLLH